MNWLDLGWIKKESEWELHPWGPFTRGYRVSNEQFLELRKRIRWVRGSLLLLVTVPFLFSGASNILGWIWVVTMAGFLEILSIHLLCRKLERSNALGWERGLFYLAKWLGPKLLMISRIIVLGLIAMSVVLIFWNASSWRPYLLTVTFIGILFFVDYLQQVQGGRLR